MVLLRCAKHQGAATCEVHDCEQQQVGQFVQLRHEAACVRALRSAWLNSRCMAHDRLCRLAVRSYSEHRAAYEDISWTREGEDICYYQSATQQPSRGRRARKKMFYKFTFTYTFKHSNDVVYFAYTFPYT